MPSPEEIQKALAAIEQSESRYLARMAHLAPETVLEVALKIPETENVRVHEDLIDAALAIPASLAREFLPKARHWIQSPYQLLLPEKWGSLVTHLALYNQVEAAFELTRVLYNEPSAGIRYHA